MNQTAKEVYTRIVQLLTEDGSIHDAIENCLESPWSYFEENIDRYDERGIDEDETEETIIWPGIADELIDANEAIELDWNPELEDFSYFMKSLADKKNLRVEDDWFDEEDTITNWFSILDRKWETAGFCVGGIDIDSDSYVLFICKEETLKELTEWSNRIDQRIDHAKNL